MKVKLTTIDIVAVTVLAVLWKLISTVLSFTWARCIISQSAVWNNIDGNDQGKFVLSCTSSGLIMINTDTSNNTTIVYTYGNSDITMNPSYVLAMLQIPNTHLGMLSWLNDWTNRRLLSDTFIYDTTNNQESSFASRIDIILLTMHESFLSRAGCHTKKLFSYREQWTDHTYIIGSVMRGGGELGGRGWDITPTALICIELVDEWRERHLPLVGWVAIEIVEFCNGMSIDVMGGSDAFSPLLSSC